MSRKWITLSLIVFAACAREQESRDAAVPVRTETVKRSTFTPALTLLGTVHPQHAIPVVTLTAGTIHYPPRFASGLQTGARVSAHELLARVANEKLVTTQEQERLRMEAADAELTRAKRTFDQGVLSVAEYSGYQLRSQLAHEAFAAAKRETQSSTLEAPASGTLVVSKVVAPGAHVESNVTLGEIASGDAPVIEAAVAASDRDLLHIGQAAKFGDTTRSGSGHVAEVAAAIDPSGTARVVIAIVSGTAPPPGSGVSVDVALDPRRDVLTVPEDALVVLPDGPGVFVLAEGEGFHRYHAKSVRVEAGRRAGGRVEILSGLRDGDRVVVSGADALTDGASVTEAEAAK